MAQKPLDTRVIELLVEWELRREQGTPVTPEELCVASPELLDEIKRRIRQIQDYEPNHLEGTTAPQPDAEYPTLPPESSTKLKSEGAPGGGRYRSIGFHARGGLGEVHRARDEELRRVVALKRIRTGNANNSDLRRRFLDEAEITAQLEHPGIVPVYGLVHDAEGNPHYAMRFVEGETMGDAIKRYHQHSNPDPLAFRQLLNQFVSACNTIAYAHDRGVMHRDLKPANVMLGKFGETLVVDWGLAKSFKDGGVEAISVDASASTPLEGQPPSHTVGAGTPEFMSPEQAAGPATAIGPACDIYGLGAMLYVILTGRAPFDRHDPHFFDKLQRGEAPPPRQWRNDAPRPLEAVCLKAMVREPATRYASALDLAADVERWLADEPVAAFPEPWLARARRWVRKHRAAVTTAAVALVLLTIASLTAATLLARAYGKEEALNSKLQDANHVLVGANRRADHNLRKSRQAVEDYFTIVSESRLLNQPSLAPLRRQLLQTALDYSQGMAREQGEDPVIRGEVAAAHFRVGQILIEMGLLSEAVTELLQGLELVEGLLKDGHSLATIPSLRAGLYQGRARNELDYAFLEKRLPVSMVFKLQMELNRAQPALRRMQEILEEEVRQSPAVPGFKNDLAGFACLAGFVQANTDQKTEAAASYRRAATLWRELAQEYPGNAEYRAQFAAALNDLGELLVEMGVPGAEPMAVFREALSVLRELSARDPATPFYRETTAFVLWNLGDQQIQGNRPSDGKQSYAEAVTLLEGLRKEYLGVPQYLFFLANTVHDYAERLEALAKSNSAERAVANEWAEKYRKLHAELEASMEKK